MSPARTTNRRGQRSRDEILDVAARVMAERGYAATSLSTLSAETGLPKSAIYHHFRSKGGLLSAVMERGMNDFFDGMREAHLDPPTGGTHRERLGWYFRRTGRVLLARQEFMRLHMILVFSAEAAEVEAEVADSIQRVRHEGRVLMNGMLRAAFEDEGEAIAQAIADRLDYFGVAGFDGAFISMQAEPARSLEPEGELLADALVLLGEQIAERLKAAAG